MTIARNLMPEPRHWFRAALQLTLAVIFYALPWTWSWWVSIAFAYMTFNMLVAKSLANGSDMLLRFVSGQPLDRHEAKRQRRGMA